MDMITVKQAAEKWGVTPRYVQMACKNGTIPGTDFEVYGSDRNTYSVPVKQIVLADAKCLVTTQVYTADGELYDTACDSLESYAARTVGTDVEALADAIMKFADSAYIYLSNR